MDIKKIDKYLEESKDAKSWGGAMAQKHRHSSSKVGSKVEYKPIKSSKKPFLYKGKWYTRDEMKKMGLDKESSKAITEGKMQKGYWVTLSNKGGELDSEFIKGGLASSMKALLIDWSSTLSDGDVIRIKKGSSEN